MDTQALKTDSSNRLILSIHSLPPLPTTAQQALDSFADEFIDADKVTRIVSEDAGLSAKLIGLSNSAYYGLSEPVESIKEAVSRVIGVETVRSLVLALAMQKSLNFKDCPAFDTERFWRESLVTALCCKKIALRDPVLSDSQKRFSYLAGLCYNIGLMALASVAPQETQSVLAGADDACFGRDMRAATGLDHRQATVELAEEWKMPDTLTKAFRCRANPAEISECRLGLILISATIAVRYLDEREQLESNINRVSKELGMAVDEIQQMALPGARQLEQIEMLASNMAR